MIYTFFSLPHQDEKSQLMYLNSNVSSTTDIFIRTAHSNGTLCITGGARRGSSRGRCDNGERLDTVLPGNRQSRQYDAVR